jgi:hypothetical protein
VSELYTGISIAALIFVVLFLLIPRKKGGQLRTPSNLAMFGTTLVVLGIIFSDDAWIGYSLIGLGVILAVIGGLTILGKSKVHPN